jgi:predicted metal-binding membrane protein
VYAVAGLAGLDLVLRAAAPLGGSAAGGHVHHGAMTMSAGSDSNMSSFLGAWDSWALMVTAMMLPVLAPQVRTVAMRSLWVRRQRSAVAFVLGYAATWFAAGGVLVAPLVALDAYPLGAPWLVGFLLVAAVWQVSAPRRRLMRRCGSLRLGPATGRPADLNCLLVGVRSGGRCLLTCGPLMLTMLASHSLVLMAGILVVLLSERSRGPDPLRRVGRPLEAWVIVAFAVAAGAVATIS